MTPPTDSLEAALRAVEPVHDCHRDDPDMCCYDAVSSAALAAAAREWMQRQMPATWYIDEILEDRVQRARRCAYNDAIAAVARALGLMETP